MSALHLHGQATPTSRVVRNSKALKSPLKKSLATTRPARPVAKRTVTLDSEITGHQLPVEADFRGLDVLSAVDYLKRLQTDLPPRLGREKRTVLLNHRRNMPSLVLGHQIASLFPNMPDLEKEVNHLVNERVLIQLPLQDGDSAYIRRVDYGCDPELLETSVQDLTDEQFREFAKQGYLIRRNEGIVLSVPNLGSYFTALKAARKFVLSHLRTANIVLEKDVKARYDAWKDGGLFQFENLMHDLVGSSRVEILMLTVGRALRITKRGREGLN